MNRRRMLASAAALAAAPMMTTQFSSPVSAAAPKLGASQPTHYRFMLGAFEITMILDADVFIDGPYPLIGANGTEADVRKLMRDSLLPETKYQPGFTPMVVNTGEQLILFDTGNGAEGFVPRPHGGWLVDQLAPAGFSPEQFDLVVLSHGHPDHIGGLLEGGKPLFPNARYAIGDVEYDFWSPEGKLTGDLEKFASLFRSMWCPSPTRLHS